MSYRTLSQTAIDLSNDSRIPHEIDSLWELFLATLYPPILWYVPSSAFGGNSKAREGFFMDEIRPALTLKTGRREKRT